jgi:hypothetical protein
VDGPTASAAPHKRVDSTPIARLRSVNALAQRLSNLVVGHGLPAERWIAGPAGGATRPNMPCPTGAPESEDPAELARHALDFWITAEDLSLAENRVLVDRDGRISLRYTPTNVEALSG